MKTHPQNHHTPPPAPLTSLFLALVWLVTLCPIAQSAQFEEVTIPAGITNAAGYTMGVAWGDYDNDNLIDLYFASGSQNPGLNKLYRNRGDGTFASVGPEAGPPTTDNHTSLGCNWIDFNNDGYRDLFVVNGGWVAGRNDVYLNDGDGSFTSVQAPQLTSRASVFSWPAFADIDRNGWVDVYLAEGTSSSAISRIFMGRPDLTFTTNDFAPPVSYANDGVWGDFDNDGDPDLFACNYTSSSQLWRNDGHGQFTAMTNGIPSNASSLHAAWADYDNDGDLDIAIGSFSKVDVYRNDGYYGFTFATNYGGSFTWPNWADYDNDGHQDLLAAGGQGSPAKAILLHNNADGTFDSVTDLVTEVADNRLGAAWGDYDNDGFMDFAIAQEQGINKLFRNLGNTNHWIKFHLAGSVSSREAIGTKIRLLATIAGQPLWQMQEVNGGWQVQNEIRLNFGLGDATTIDRVIVEWASGNVSELKDVTVDQILPVSEPVSIQPLRPSPSLGCSVTLWNRVPGSHQWRFDGTDLSNQTNSTLILTNITATQEGRYSVVTERNSVRTTNWTWLHVDTRFRKITDQPPATDLGTTWGAAWGFLNDNPYPVMFVPRRYAGTSALYQYQPDGSFNRMPSMDLWPQSDAWANGAIADFDNDGRRDLFALRNGMSAWFYYGNPDGTLTAQESLPLNLFSSAVADYDRNGHLDIFIPAYPSGPGTLLHNDGNRGFSAQTAQDIGSLATDPTFGNASWADYDDDGWLELYVASWPAGNRLYKRDASGKFAAVDNLITQTGQPDVTGTWADYDNDGDLDLCVAAFGTTAHSTVYRNLGNGQFEQADLGLTLPSANSATWADFDNDGFLDLFTTYSNGLFHNNGDGTFTRITTGVVGVETSEASYSYCGMWFDYDNNGFLDLYVLNGNDSSTAQVPNFLYQNAGNTNAWLKVKLVGTRSNRDGVGAVVRCQAYYADLRRWQRRDITAGSCDSGANPIAHFGLGYANRVDNLIIQWPSGIQQQLSNISARQTLTVVEPCLTGRFDHGGALQLEVACDTNRTYYLDTSNDLMNWTRISSFSSGSSTYTDPQADPSHRFYRLK